MCTHKIGNKQKRINRESPQALKGIKQLLKLGVITELSPLI